VRFGLLPLSYDVEVVVVDEAVGIEEWEVEGASA